MVVLLNSTYPITAFCTINRAQFRPRLSLVRCSVRVLSSLPVRRVRRRNSLRPKILKTLTKPYRDSVDDNGLETCVEPEKSGLGVVEELETSVGVDGVGLGGNVTGFEGINGWMVGKIVVSFVGLFVLQTVVSVWIMGSGEKDKSLRNEGRNADVGVDGSVVAGVSDLRNVDEWKIAVIRRMAREVREGEKRKSNVKKGEADVEDESDYDEDEDDEIDSPLRNDIAKEIDGRLRMLRKRSPNLVQNVNFLKTVVGSKEVKNESVDGKEENNRFEIEAKRKTRIPVAEPDEKPKGFGGGDDLRENGRNMNEAKSEKSDIVMGKDDEKPLSPSFAPFQANERRSSSEEENKGNGIDGRLPMLSERSPVPVRNVNFLKNAWGSEEVKNEGVDGKEEDNRLMYEAKRKYRSHMAEPGNKPKGFERIDGVRGNGKNTNDAKSESSSPFQTVKKSSANEKENKGKGINGSSNSRSVSIDGLSKAMDKGGKPESGVIQDSSNRNSVDAGAKLKESSVIENRESQRKMNDENASTSKMDTVPSINTMSDSGKLKSTNQDTKNNDDSDLWWSTLPYVFVILMQKGHGSEVRQGFYTLYINSNSQFGSSYTVAFEDQTDAKNFTYILESTFEDLRDAAVDVALLSISEFNEMIEAEGNNVVVVRKRELKLYAGQSLDDAEFALRLLVK